MDDIRDFELGLETRNTSLKSISFEGISHHGVHKQLPMWTEKIKFSLKMNRVGRAALLQSPDDAYLWGNALVQNRSDPKISFELLSTNLSVFCPDQWKTVEGTYKKAQKTKRRKVSH